MKLHLFLGLVLAACSSCHARKNPVPSGSLLARDSSLLKRDAESHMVMAGFGQDQSSKATAMVMTRARSEAHHIFSMGQLKVLVSLLLIFSFSAVIVLSLIQQNRSGLGVEGACAGVGQPNAAMENSEQVNEQLEAGLAVPRSNIQPCIASEVLSNPSAPVCGIICSLHSPDTGASPLSPAGNNTVPESFSPQFTPEHKPIARCLDEDTDSTFDLAAGDSPRTNTSPRTVSAAKPQQKKRMSLSNWWEESEENSATPSLACDDVDAFDIGSRDSPCANPQAKACGRVSLSNWWETPGKMGAPKPPPLSPDTGAMCPSSDTPLVMQVASPTRRRSLHKGKVEVVGTSYRQLKKDKRNKYHVAVPDHAA